MLLNLSKSQVRKRISSGKKSRVPRGGFKSISCCLLFLLLLLPFSPSPPPPPCTVFICPADFLPLLLLLAFWADAAAARWHRPPSSQRRRAFARRAASACDRCRCRCGAPWTCSQHRQPTSHGGPERPQPGPNFRGHCRCAAAWRSPRRFGCYGSACDVGSRHVGQSPRLTPRVII